MAEWEKKLPHLVSLSLTEAGEKERPMKEMRKKTRRNRQESEENGASEAKERMSLMVR